METLVQIRDRLFAQPSVASKPRAYFEIYETLFAGLRDQPIKLVEVGVFEGESTEVFAEYFPDGRILGIDLLPAPARTLRLPNVSLFQADQTSATDLRRIMAEHAPSGADIVIDDASHFGRHSLATWRALFPCVKPGGLYIVEDWATGYVGAWPDGRAYRERSDVAPWFDRRTSRILGHDYGMVGFVKHLVDLVGLRALPGNADASDVASMAIYPGVAVLQKAVPDTDR